MGNMVVNPIAFFTDLLGKPLQKGSVFIGTANTNPVTNQLTVYQDAAMTIPMTQPLTTTNGFVSLNGSPQPFFVNAASFSLLVNDSNGNLCLSIANYTNLLANQTGAGGAAQIGFDGTTLDQQFANRVNRVVDSIAALRALSKATYTRAIVTGYYAAGDKPSRFYYFDPNDTTSADNGGTIIVATDGGRWKMQLEGNLSAADFGAKCDWNGSTGTNDTPVITNLFTWLNANGGGVAYVPFGKQCLIDTSLTIPANCTLKGPRLVTGSPGTNSSAPYGNMGGALVLNSAATITIGSNASIQGLLIYRKGMTFPAADASLFAGTALTVGGDDASVFGCMTLGFNKAFYSSGYQRCRVDYLLFDCVNGIEITNCADVPHIRKCHGWPFSTIAANGAHTTIERTGTAYYFHDLVDDGKVTDCFSYGYAIGTHVSNANGVTLLNMTHDNTFNGTPQNTGSVGILVDGTSQETRILGPQVSAHDAASIKVNTSAGLVTEIQDGDLWSTGGTGGAIVINGGDVLIEQNTLRNHTNGITVSNASSYVKVNGNRFDTISQIINCTVATSNVDIGTNEFASSISAGQQIVVGTLTAASVASAASVNLPMNGDVFTITGTTSFGTLYGGWLGRQIQLVFSAALTVYNGTGAQTSMHLMSGANFSPGANSTLTLKHNGTQWYEVGRS